MIPEIKFALPAKPYGYEVNVIGPLGMNPLNDFDVIEIAGIPDMIAL
jgi:hypothetical protein